MWQFPFCIVLSSIHILFLFVTVQYLHSHAQ